MMIPSEHGMLDLAGMGLIANIIGLIVLMLAILGIYRARAPKVLLFWLVVAVGGLAVVIGGTTVVIASE
jgi:heme A synthase